MGQLHVLLTVGQIRPTELSHWEETAHVVKYVFFNANNEKIPHL